ncbi:unnamed protein product [Cyprideis torosa]|uniref:ADAM10 endopeptidase n=1 Tax=Cyprideis torosa TaxID=163714 RepID=A0A7R8W3M9_9CRUS|nr:unnamed protein product [Cyprideis torosa]CAG0882296.1 unnamed protein product [Cyprideis torosa]
MMNIALQVSSIISLDFSSHGEEFQLRLRRDTSTFRPDFRMHLSRGAEDADEPVDLDLSHLVVGRLHGVPNSMAFGSLWDGVFEGNIETPSGTFYVERTHKYFGRNSAFNKEFHSLIYSENAVSDPPLGHDTLRDAAFPEAEAGTCGLKPDRERIMQDISASLVTSADEALQRRMEERRPQAAFLDRMGDVHGNGTVDVQGNGTLVPARSRRVKRRSNLFLGRSSTQPFNGGIGNGNNNGTCEMFIRTDPLLYKYYLEHEELPQRQIKEEIASLVQQLIKGVSNIYSNTKFNMGRFNHTGITFAVQRIRVSLFALQRIGLNLMVFSEYAAVWVDNYTEDCMTSRAPVNPFCSANIDVTSFLTQFSRNNHDAFCLAFMLTFRDFSDGTLGLAWVASGDRENGEKISWFLDPFDQLLLCLLSSSGNKGGVCERRGRISGQKEEMSLNTGVVTFLNYASHVTPKVSQLTLAHEIGHNFGAAERSRILDLRRKGFDSIHVLLILSLQHDPEDQAKCIPGVAEGGNYIMYRHATKGNLPNNRKFSMCSVMNISSVLDAIYLAVAVDNGKHYCFKVTIYSFSHVHPNILLISASNLAFCGNRIVEPGEECDCGFDSYECLNDPCCFPRINDDGLHNPQACTLVYKRPQSCSPSQGPCCDGRTCRIITRTDELECGKETECKNPSFCDGTTPQCPQSVAKPNLTPCNVETQVCQAGECTGAFCLRWGMQECFLTEDKVEDKGKLCELACFDQHTKQCLSSSALELAYPNSTFRTIRMMPGSACNNYEGYCDVFQKCRRVDREGPILRLKNLLFGKETVNAVAEWVMVSQIVEWVMVSQIVEWVMVSQIVEWVMVSQIVEWVMVRQIVEWVKVSQIVEWVMENWWATVLIAFGFILGMGAFIRCCAVHTPSSNPRKPPPRKLQDTFVYGPMHTARRVGTAAGSTLRRLRHPHHHGGAHGHHGGHAAGRGHAPRSVGAGNSHHENWWATVLIAFGFILGMGAFIRCCAVHTPSSNPRKPPPRKLQDTFVYGPMHTARRVGTAAGSTLRRLRHPHHHGGAHGHHGGHAAGRGHAPRSVGAGNSHHVAGTGMSSSSSQPSVQAQHMQLMASGGPPRGHRGKRREGRQAALPASSSYPVVAPKWGARSQELVPMEMRKPGDAKGGGKQKGKSSNPRV